MSLRHLLTALLEICGHLRLVRVDTLFQKTEFAKREFDALAVLGVVTNVHQRL